MRMTQLHRGRTEPLPAPEGWREACLALAQGAPYVPAGLSHDLESLLAPSDSACFLTGFVAWDDNGVAGFLLLRVAFTDADVDYICVSPVRLRSGVASRLLREAAGFCACQGIERIVLEVGLENAPALALYEKHGFQRIAVRKKYYAGREDALILEKRIPSEADSFLDGHHGSCATETER